MSIFKLRWLFGTESKMMMIGGMMRMSLREIFIFPSLKDQGGDKHIEHQQEERDSEISDLKERLSELRSETQRMLDIDESIQAYARTRKVRADAKAAGIVPEEYDPHDDILSIKKELGIEALTKKQKEQLDEEIASSEDVGMEKVTQDSRDALLHTHVPTV